ncbi:hypothetical protein ABZW47_32145 [Streptomyces sp. NPDC004549]
MAVGDAPHAVVASGAVVDEAAEPVAELPSRSSLARLTPQGG